MSRGGPTSPATNPPTAAECSTEAAATAGTGTFSIFGLLSRHTVSNPITTKMHTTTVVQFGLVGWQCNKFGFWSWFLVFGDYQGEVNCVQ